MLTFAAFTSLSLFGGVFTKYMRLHGTSTFFEAVGEQGACTLPFNSFQYKAAVGPTHFHGSPMCSQCVKVTDISSGKSIVATIVDQCLSCGPNDVTLDRNAFNSISNVHYGSTRVHWEVVRCSGITGNIQYNWMQGSSQWWASLQIRKNAVGIKKVEAFYNGKWNTATRNDNYVFVFARTGSDSLKIRITSVEDQVIEDDDVPILSSGGIFYSSRGF